MSYFTDEQLQCWEHHGYVHIPAYLDDKATAELQQWVTQLTDWPETAGKWMKYFESTAANDRQLCRVENFIEYHEGFEELLAGARIYGMLSELMSEQAVLFKEKINFKLPGGSGFGVHQDAPAFTSFGQKYHITMMLSVDDSTVENGCLQVVKNGWHKKGLLPQAEDGSIDREFAKTLNWEHLPVKAGDMLLFDSYIPHGSDGNTSDKSRRALYVTYNKLSEGDHRRDYYADKRIVFPPEIEREAGKDYSNAGVYNVGNPVRT